MQIKTRNISTPLTPALSPDEEHSLMRQATLEAYILALEAHMSYMERAKAHIASDSYPLANVPKLFN